MPVAGPSDAVAANPVWPNPDLTAFVVVVIGLFLGWLGNLLITHFIWHNPANRLER